MFPSPPPSPSPDVAPRTVAGGYQKASLEANLNVTAVSAWKTVYAELADGFGANVAAKPDWSPVEQDMLATIDIEKLLAVERRTTERP